MFIDSDDSKNISDFKNIPGTDILNRGMSYFAWVNKKIEDKSWLFYKSTIIAPTSRCEGYDESGRRLSGTNFASQDYLSLASHPRLKAAALEAIQEYGVHSASSPAGFGRSIYYHRLCTKLADILRMPAVVLYPTGWAAGYGVITGLVRKFDYIVMDIFSHNCLQEGAFAATSNVYLTPHLNNAVIEERLKSIRNRAPDSGILVVTESLFSMDSDTPDLKMLQQICSKYSANLLIDCAHDFGALGEKGMGNIELQNLTNMDNVILIGSGSKVLASNLGFVACHSKAAIEYLKAFSGPLVFSNALSPIQANVALQALKVVSSAEGSKRRSLLMQNITYLREKLRLEKFNVLGCLSPVIPILIGDEHLTRLMVGLMLDNDIIVHHAEYPAVPKGSARIRLQIMADHSRAQLNELVSKLIKAKEKADSMLHTIHSEQI